MCSKLQGMAAHMQLRPSRAWLLQLMGTPAVATAAPVRRRAAAGHALAAASPHQPMRKAPVAAAASGTAWHACNSPHQRASLRQRRLAPARAAQAVLADGLPVPVPRWRQVVLITAGALLLCNLHRATFSVLLPELSVQWGLTPSQAGTLQATMLAAYLAGQLPSGALADWHGGVRVLLAGLALWSAATAVAACASSVEQLLASRVLMGLGSAAIMPCVAAMSVAWVPPGERSASTAFVWSMFNIGERPC